MNDTIIAQCTPTGNGALALLRVSGPDARAIIARCSRLSSTANINHVTSHTIHHGFILDQENNVCDEVMFLIMDAPRTFTGHNTIEITTHNNPFIIEAVINRIIACGARLAHNGEFSRQAVENGKLDLIKAEAINELIHAQSQEALKRSLSQLHGSFSYWVSQLEQRLLHLLALCEASFEFLEEDVDFSSQMKTMAQEIMQTISSIADEHEHQKIIKEGVRIALIGSVNAGKSSLFNKLLKKERAIVTPIAGTTRDAIEGSMYYNGIYWTIIDTAGLRQTEDVVEQYGIQKSYQEAESADLVLLVCDGSRIMTPQEETIYTNLQRKYSHKIIVVISKQDAAYIDHPLYEEGLHISATTGHNIAELESHIQSIIHRMLATNSSPFLINKRHVTLLHACAQELSIVIQFLETSPQYELIAHHLHAALTTLTELTGKTISDKMLDTVFSTFCVGK